MGKVDCHLARLRSPVLWETLEELSRELSLIVSLAVFGIDFMTQDGLMKDRFPPKHTTRNPVEVQSP